MFQETSTSTSRAISIPSEKQEERTVASIAKECLIDAGGDWKKAAELMQERIDGDDKLFRELVQPMISQAIWYQIRMAAHAARASYKQSANVDDATGLKAVAKETRRKWLDYLLSGGVKLGDADKAKLTTESEMHAAFARGNEIKAQFLASIAKKVGDKKVRDVLDDDQIEKLWEKVQ